MDPVADEPEHHRVVVVGGGQAGLSMSWCLSRDGIDHTVLERDSVGHEWADARWDTFCLVTPNWQCRLPGWSYDGPDPDGFMLRTEVVEFLRSYRASFDPPVREGVGVTDLTRRPDGSFALATTAGEMTAEHVVLATGGYHRPLVPPWAQRLPASVTQVHSARYRGPDQLPEGAVLVVGSGQSGAQITEDLHLAGRDVHLCVGSAPRVSRRYRGRDVMTWLAQMGQYDIAVADIPDGGRARFKTNHYVTGRGGGHDLDLRAFARDGIGLHGRLLGLDGTTLRIGDDLAAKLDAADAVNESILDGVDRWIAAEGIDAPPQGRYAPVWQPGPANAADLDLLDAGITSVVWAIGYRTDYSWVRLPAFDGSGSPVHDRGMTPVAGLYVLGLPWLHTWGSGRFLGVARDAEHLAAVVSGRPAAHPFPSASDGARGLPRERVDAAVGS